MKLFVEPCGPHGLPFSPPSGMTDVAELTFEPWQSVQNIVCAPTPLLQGSRQLFALSPPRTVGVRPVVSITGCHDRWLLDEYAAAAPESPVVTSPLCESGA